jgi:hypothetical protein
MRPALLATMLWACSACTSLRSAPPDASITHDDGGPTPSDGGYAASACRQCVAGACSVALAACSGDPDCAGYLACVDACGTDDAGNVNPACEAACPRGSSTAGALAIQKLTRCRTAGQGALCVACGTAASADLSPALRNNCPQQTADAACTTCHEDHCCQSLAACDTACQGFFGCISDGGAYLDCDKSYPGGRLLAETEETCLLVFCCNADACASCGQNSTQCDECEFQLCPTEYANLRTTEYGSLYVECATETQDAGGCLAMYPQAQDAINALSVCVTNNCLDCLQ